MSVDSRAGTLPQPSDLRFNWAVVRLAATPGWLPDVIHCHDWHCGLLAQEVKQGADRAGEAWTLDSLGVVLTPIVITGLAVWFTKRPQRSNVWTMSMVALAAYIFLFAGPYGIITLPVTLSRPLSGKSIREIGPTRNRSSSVPVRTSHRRRPCSIGT